MYYEFVSFWASLPSVWFWESNEPVSSYEVIDFLSLLSTCVPSTLFEFFNTILCVLQRYQINFLHWLHHMICIQVLLHQEFRERSYTLVTSLFRKFERALLQCHNWFIKNYLLLNGLNGWDFYDENLSSPLSPKISSKWNYGVPISSYFVSGNGQWWWHVRQSSRFPRVDLKSAWTLFRLETIRNPPQQERFR